LPDFKALEDYLRRELHGKSANIQDFLRILEVISTVE
jgi:hypothetical protein